MKAMVLCAGFGTRLGELTREIPKPMLRVGERPLLEHIVRNLARHGFDDVMVNLHFRPEAIRDYFGDGSRWGVRLSYSDEPRLLGTAGGVKNVARFFADEAGDGPAGGQPFLVHYGDIVTNQDLTALWNSHCERRALATLLVHRRAGSNSALGLDDDGRIVQFLERPTDEQRRAVASPWVFSGISVCDPVVLRTIPAGEPCDLPRDVYPKLLETRRLFAFPLTGQRWAIDSPERLEQARAATSQWADEDGTKHTY